MMPMVGVRVAAMGGRGFLQWQQWQCSVATAGGASPRPMLPLLIQHRQLSDIPLLREKTCVLRPSLLNRPTPFLLPLQCALQDPSSSSSLVLLDMKEFADGSIMFRFGTDEECNDSLGHSGAEEVDGISTLQKDLREREIDSAGINGVSTAQKGSMETLQKQEAQVAKSVDLQGELAAGEAGTSDDVLGTSWKDQTALLGDSEIAPDTGDVPDPTTLSSIVAAAAHLVEEIDEKKKANSSAASTQSTPKVADRTGFAGIGMQERNQEDVHLNSAAAMIPHPNKVETGGEDAYFIEGVHWVGVADGVGGWALSGVNAGDYARELMWNCGELARKGSSDPKSVLVKAAGKTKAKGTAAAIVASVYDQTLQVANIGDSGFVVVRDAAVVAKSKPMVRGFNFPYQIGTAGDDPITAEAYEFQVTKDDVLVLGSDGIFDNLFEGQIVAVIIAVRKAQGGPEVIARELVKLAQKVGHMKQGVSPFAVAAHGAGYTSYVGGKLDDTTAVVAVMI